jgi:hypothetical protein
MTGYYVLGIAMVVGAVVLSAIGLTRESFPPSRGVARALIAGTFLLVLAGAAVLLATTEKEHPREEAAEKAELAAEAKGEPQGEAEGKPAGAPEGGGGGKTVRALEDEFSIKLEGGNSLAAGKYRFQVANQGKIDHDLEIEGGGFEEKTPLIAPGDEAAL